MYDREVVEVIGSDAFDYLIEEVKRGIISAQHMKDIAHQLHNHVYGKHLQRLGLGIHSAEAEFRDILSDWYNEEICSLEKQTALQKLVTIFILPSKGSKQCKLVQICVPTYYTELRIH